RLWQAALWTAGLGGLLAAAVLAIGEVGRHFRQAAAKGARRPASIPYAPAITLGAWLSLVPRM
ncbi:MAG: hypothetical protein ABI165_03630, partial [Bryobacteraceae bacterium]